MSRLDAKGRIMGGDPRYGLICGCGNLKGWQSRTCWTCYVDSVRGKAYWQRRTCDCGGPKSHDAPHCLRCEHERKRGQSAIGRPQPADHPWRRERFSVVG